MTKPILRILLVLVCTPLFAQAPSAAWRTLSTPHFRVHYPAEDEGWAKRAASELESVRAAVVEQVGFSPPQVTDVLVMNPVADANGMTLPLLDHPRIVLDTEPPQPQSQIGEFNDWITLLTVHEMTHLIHLLRPSRNPLERLIGRLLPLNPITLEAPRWVLEGYATVIEGRLTGSGRPASSIRAAILREWAIAGQLPSYSGLDSGGRFLGGSMAYLVGSAFLEWLEERAGPGSLRNLWARMTARQRRSFDDAFAGVFGDPPAKLYGVFVADLTERAKTVASRVQPLREGQLWQEMSGATGDPAVAPDGKRIAVVVRNAAGREAKLVVLSTGPNPEEKKTERRIREMLRRDPEDVAPVRTKPLPRQPLFTLRSPDGGDIENPRWTRDGKSILYTHKQPDPAGFLHHDLFLWTLEPPENRRVTHLADVEDADPMPDGFEAIAVRDRDGFSQLVKVRLSDGTITAYTEPSLRKIYSHPRASAGGRIVWAEHDGTWTVEGVPHAFSPEWGRDGALFATSASSGFIDLARIDGTLRPVTRSAGAALDPAPAPDGSIYFLSLQPDGFVMRHLTEAEPSPERLPPLAPSLAPAVPLPPPAPAVFRREPLAPARPYGIGRQEFAGVAGGAWTAYGHSGEIGARMGDVVGRLDALAIASSGSDSTDRGVAAAAAWRGWPVAVTAHLFDLEHHRGAELRGEYQFHAPLYQWGVEAGETAMRSSSRAFAEGVFALRQRKSGVTLRAAADSTNAARVSVRGAATVFGIGVALSAERGRELSIGGIAASVTPDGLQLERVSDPALPLEFTSAHRYRGVRGELVFGRVTAFWQRHDVGPSSFDVRGIEASLASPPIPLIDVPAFRVTAGIARVAGLRGTKAWISLRWRP